MYTRILNLKELLNEKSYFLFGSRGTGKSTLIRNTLPEAEFPVINLLHSEVRLKLLNNPSDLRRMVSDFKTQNVIIDEFQKVPELLDEVHDLIETKNIKFLLTGSSARKLKRESANLLAGRARVAHFFPFTYAEITNFNREKFLHMGGLPGIYTSQSPWEDLRAYVDTYLKEEIEQEAQVRKLGQFSRFLFGAALHSGDLLNFASVGSDAQVSESTVRGYYQVLSDTLMGTLVEPFRESKKRKAIQTAKFYFFDVGVMHAILNFKTLERHSFEYGKALEHWMFMELSAYLSYKRIFESLRFWRSVNGQEVDFIIGNEIGIEVKATKRVTKKDISGLKALSEEDHFKKLYLVSNEPHSHKIDNVECCSFEKFLQDLWSGKIIP